MSALASKESIRDINPPSTARVIKVSLHEREPSFKQQINHSLHNDDARLSPSIHTSLKSKFKNDTLTNKKPFNGHRNLDSILFDEINQTRTKSTKKVNPDLLGNTDSTKILNLSTYSATNKSTKSIIDDKFKQKTNSATVNSASKKIKKRRKNPYNFRKPQGISPLNTNNVTNDFFHGRVPTKKKTYFSFCHRPCSLLCIFGGILVVLFLCTAIAAILVGILIKNTSATSIAPTATLDATNSLVNPCTSGLYWNVTGTTYVGTNTGIPGSALNELSSPVSLYIDSNDTLYVGDGGNRRVMKYKLGAINGVRVAGTGAGGPGLNQLSSAGFRYIYVDSNENIYISDYGNHRVVRWASGASSGVIVAGNGSLGTALEQLYSPSGLWVDSNSNVYVSEYFNDRVTKWPLGATTGILVAGNTSQSGATSETLWAPAGLYFDEANQDLYVANAFAAGTTVMRWRIGNFYGTVIGGIAGWPGSNATQLTYPMGLTVDRWKNLYVTDLSGAYVKLFCKDKRDGIVIAGSRTGGTSLSSPYDVKLDSQMNLYVVQRNAHRVTKFLKLNN